MSSHQNQQNNDRSPSPERPSNPEQQNFGRQNVDQRNFGQQNQYGRQYNYGYQNYNGQPPRPFDARNQGPPRNFGYGQQNFGQQNYGQPNFGQQNFNQRHVGQRNFGQQNQQFGRPYNNGYQNNNGQPPHPFDAWNQGPPRNFVQQPRGYYNGPPRNFPNQGPSNPQNGRENLFEVPANPNGEGPAPPPFGQPGQRDDNRDIKETENLEQERQKAAKKKEAEDKREASKALWGMVSLDYEPEAWRTAYLEKHTESFESSVQGLQQLESISASDAKEKLLEILTKTTFVESHLTKNGRQRIGELYESLQKAAEKAEKPNPFGTVESLTKFLECMRPVFLIDSKKGKWFNSGGQTRRFCQWITQRLKLGDVISHQNYRADFDEFKTTIEAGPIFQNFAIGELASDITNYFRMARLIPGFFYDKSTKILSLTPGGVSSLTLCLPIFTDTIHGKNPFKCDYSRDWHGFIFQVTTGDNTRAYGKIVSEQLNGVPTVLFRKHLEKDFEKLISTKNTVIFGRGHITPNHEKQQVELFGVSPHHTLSQLNPFVSIDCGRLMDKYGSLAESDFSKFQNFIEEAKLINRPYITNESKQAMKEKKDAVEKEREALCKFDSYTGREDLEKEKVWKKKDTSNSRKCEEEKKLSDIEDGEIHSDDEQGTSGAPQS